MPAYLLLLIAGPLGAHHWYLGANHLASKQLTMFLCGVGLCVAGGPAALFGLLFLLLPLSLWLTVDLFLIPAQCRSRR